MCDSCMIVGNFEYHKDQDNNWIFKSIDTKNIKKEKAQYKDKVQYKVIEESELKIAKNFDHFLQSSLKQIENILS